MSTKKKFSVVSWKKAKTEQESSLTPKVSLEIVKEANSQLIFSFSSQLGNFKDSIFAVDFLIVKCGMFPHNKDQQ